MENFTSNITIGSPMSHGHFLQQVCTSLGQDLLPMQALNTTILSPYVNPQNIDCLVKMEMERIRETCARKEEQYVEQMLVENPITIERRPNGQQTPPPPTKIQQQYAETSLYYHRYDAESSLKASRDDNGNDKAPLLPLDQQQLLLQQQRAEACRRSRYNNKIRKAKSKYRHKYMSQKLVQSSQMFDCIQDLIAQAESHLLAQGLSKEKLQQLRSNYGMNKDKALSQ